MWTWQNLFTFYFFLRNKCIVKPSQKNRNYSTCFSCSCNVLLLRSWGINDQSIVMLQNIKNVCHYAAVLLCHYIQTPVIVSQKATERSECGCASVSPLGGGTRSGNKGSAVRQSGRHSLKSWFNICADLQMGIDIWHRVENVAETVGDSVSWKK